MPELDIQAIRDRVEAASQATWRAEASAWLDDMDPDRCCVEEGDAEDGSEQFAAWPDWMDAPCPAADDDDGCPGHIEHEPWWIEGPQWVEVGGGDWLCMTQGDAQFVAHARTDIPLLLEEIERLRRDGGHLNSLLAWAMEELIARDGMSDDDYRAGLIPEHSCSPDDCTCSFGMNYMDAVRTAFSDPPDFDAEPTHE